LRRTTSAWTTAALGGVLTASLVWAQQSSSAGDPPRAGTSTADGSSLDTGTDADPLSNIPAHRGARYLMRNGLDYLKYQQYERALAFLREAEARKKELNAGEKRLLDQGIERARQGLRLASNAESPYALSEQSKHRNGFVPARSGATKASDGLETAATTPAPKAKRRPVRSDSADLELKPGDSEEPIRLTSTEITTPAPTAQPDPLDSAPTGRNGRLPQIPKLTAVPTSPETPNDLPQANEPTAGQTPAPAALAMARPPAELPAAAMPVMEASPPVQPATAAPVAATSEPVLEPIDATAKAAVQAPANGNPNAPLLILDNDAPPAASSSVKEPAAPVNRADAEATTSAAALAALLPQGGAPVPVVPTASPQPAATPTAPEGLSLSPPPSGAETPDALPSLPPNTTAPAIPAEPAPTPPTPTATAAAPVITHAPPLLTAVPEASEAAIAAASPTEPAAAEPLITKPPVVALDPATPAIPPAGVGDPSVAIPTEIAPADGSRATATPSVRAADAGAVRVANTAPLDGLPPLPDELSRSTESAPIQPAPAATAVPAAAPAEAVAPMDDALPPLPVELGRPSPIPGEPPTRPIGTPPQTPNADLPAVTRAESPPATTTPALPALDSSQPAAVPTPATADAPAQPTSVPVATEPAIARETVSPVDVSATPVVTPEPAMPATGTPADATSAAGVASAPVQSPDPFLPERRMEGSNLKPRLIREVEEVARRQEDALQNQVAAPQPPQPATVRDTSPTDLKTQFQLDISRAPSPAEARPIKAIPVPEDWVPLGQRNWAPQRKFWAAAATCHLPLYFQDPVLERYGHNVEQFAGPIAKYLSYPVDDPRQSTQNNQVFQPFFSAGLMALQIVALPYNVVMDPPWEAQYDLGYYRPGDVIPTDTYWLPLHGYGPPLRGNNY
jgi:hypothetical protein